MGLFYCAAPLSGAFGGLLATGLSEIRYNGYDRWPWIFIVEGVCWSSFLTTYITLKCQGCYNSVWSLDGFLLTAHSWTNQILDGKGTLGCPQPDEVGCTWSNAGFRCRSGRLLNDVGRATQSPVLDLEFTDG